MKFGKRTVKAMIIIAICFFFGVACNDDDSKEMTNNPLLGTWQWTINDRSDCGSPADEGKIPLTDCSEGCHYYEFSADGILKVTLTEGGTNETGTGTYTLSDGNLKLCIMENGEESCISGEVTISGDRFSWYLPKIDETSCDVNRIFERI